MSLPSNGGICLSAGGSALWLRRGGLYPPPVTTGYGRQAGSMHPTGMLSCCIDFGGSVQKASALKPQNTDQTAVDTRV